MSRIHHFVFFVVVFFLFPCVEFSMLHSDSSFSYQNYKTVLKTYVDGKGFVDYRGLKNNSAELDAFLTQLTNIESEKYQSWTVPDKKHTIYLSSIFKWFGEDFLAGYSGKAELKSRNPEENAVLNFISLHIPAKLQQFLGDPSYRIKYIKYDWNLNEKVN